MLYLKIRTEKQFSLGNPILDFLVANKTYGSIIPEYIRILAISKILLSA